MIVTRAERNVIFELGGRPALERLQETFVQLPTREQRLVQQALHLGVAVDEYSESFRYGDYLIRNVLQVNEEEKSIQASDFLQVGQTIQFHIRDHESASCDLKQCLERSRQEFAPGQPAAALTFTCNGRGVNLFPENHHDARMIQRVLGTVPVGGIFAAGEFGPVGSKNFVHGYTCCVIWFI
jgi:small ligand-binding sensory domain FIST